MNSQLCSDRGKLLTKMNGQLAFLNVALKALNHPEIGGKIVTQMHRGLTSIRGSLRHSDSPDLEAFACDFEDLLELLCAGEIKLTTEVVETVRSSTEALTQGVAAMDREESVSDVIDAARDAVFSQLLEHAVTVKR